MAEYLHPKLIKSLQFCASISMMQLSTVFSRKLRDLKANRRLRIITCMQTMKKIFWKIISTCHLALLLLVVTFNT